MTPWLTPCTHSPCRLLGDDFIVFPHLEVPAAGCGGQEGCLSFTGTLARPPQLCDVCSLIGYLNTEVLPSCAMLSCLQYWNITPPELAGEGQSQGCVERRSRYFMKSSAARNVLCESLAKSLQTAHYIIMSCLHRNKGSPT